jgi:hypothetical protein
LRGAFAALCNHFHGGEKGRRAAAVQDAGAISDDSQTTRSVWECASPLALWDRGRINRLTGRRGGA